MQIGKMVGEACEVHTSVATPRSFSFLNKGSNGAQYNDDTWFLAKSYSTDSMQEGDTPGRVFYHLVVLDAAFCIKAYTFPFILPEMGTSTNADTALFLREDGEIVIVFTDNSEEGDTTSLVHRFSLTDLGPLLVAGPKH
jgi:hypothetical protein